MLAVDRRHRILERVAEEQTTHIAELAGELGVSEMTIRRDIARLERDGFLRRTYGGATAHLTKSIELAFNARALQHAAAKRLIGMRAVELVRDARTMFLAMGSTCEQFARFLPAREDLTVVTESLAVASLLGSRPMGVVVLGGTVRRDELSCHGPAAIATLSRHRADVAILGTPGLSSAEGLTEFYEEEAENHRRMIERSARVIVLADGSKFGERARADVAPAKAIDVLVTDSTARTAELKAWARLGVEVIVAQLPSERSARVGRQPSSKAGRRAMRLVRSATEG